jgi:fumarate reductase subunit D
MRGIRLRAGHPAYWAFWVHRLSGLGLAVFLPAHFLLLGSALQGEQQLAGQLAWTHSPAARAGEILLALGLAAHLFGGLRLLLLEWCGLTRGQGRLIALSLTLSLLYALLFALQVL